MFRRRFITVTLQNHQLCVQTGIFHLTVNELPNSLIVNLSTEICQLLVIFLSYAARSHPTQPHPIITL